jgi:hypothetical protein
MSFSNTTKLYSCHVIRIRHALDIISNLYVEHTRPVSPTFLSHPSSSLFLTVSSLPSYSSRMLRDNGDMWRQGETTTTLLVGEAEVEEGALLGRGAGTTRCQWSR